MRERFHAEPIIQATELLLQERVPREVASTRPWAAEVKSAARASDAGPSGGRRLFPFINPRRRHIFFPMETTP